MSNEIDKEKITWKSWLALIFLIVTFSGALMNAPAPWKAFDFQVLVGKFGQIVPGINFQGKGGFGAQEGFLFSLILIPTLMLALGLIAVAESLGALNAAEKLFRPLLRPLMGIPGMAGIAFVSSITSSDAGAIMTKTLYDEGHISDDERTIFASYMYAGSAPVTNTVGLGAPLLGISLLPVGAVIAIIILVKIIGANGVRIYLNRMAAKAQREGN
jgi:nucleoside recognition membrane protein YjiH